MFSSSSDINPCHSLFFDRDHLRSNMGIICSLIWGSFAVRDHLRPWDHLRTRTVLVLLLNLVSRGRHADLNSLNFWQARMQTTERLMLLSESKQLEYTSVKVWLDYTTSPEPTGERSLSVSRRIPGWKLTSHSMTTISQSTVSESLVRVLSKTS